MLLMGAYLVAGQTPSLLNLGDSPENVNAKTRMPKMTVLIFFLCNILPNQFIGVRGILK